MLTLSTGKQIKLYGNSMAIGHTLEIGEGSVPNIFSARASAAGQSGVNNPSKLTVEELMELADYNIQLWMDLKANLRRYTAEDGKVFAGER